MLNLYFDGNQRAPDVSGLFGPSCVGVCAVSHWNGLDLFGYSGLGGNTNAQEAGTLDHTVGDVTISLTRFNWYVNERVDVVWPYWDNTGPYSNGSGRPDFVGEVWLTVAAVPAPGSLALLVAGVGVSLAANRRSRRDRPSRIPASA